MIGQTPARTVIMGAATAAPVALSAAVTGGLSNQIAVTFDRAVTASSAAGWSIASDAGGSITGLAGVAGAVVTFDTDTFYPQLFPTTISYSGSGDTAGSPDGVPVAAFSDLSVTGSS